MLHWSGAGLDAVKDIIKVTTLTLLEEPRAELTALHTLQLMLKAGMVSEVPPTPRPPPLPLLASFPWTGTPLAVMCMVGVLAGEGHPFP